MKGEDLQGLGLSDEQVGRVMAMHSSELNDTRSKLTAAEQERDSFKTQIDSNNSGLENLREASKDNEELQF